MPTSSGRSENPDRKDFSQYPHGLHPALVPGISVDDQRNAFGVDKVVAGVTGILIIAFIIWGVLSPASVASVAATAFGWAMRNVGWLLNAVCGLGIVLMAYLACSRYGKIKLGRDDEEPEFSRFSWVAMMFGAGIGVGIFFFGPSEPLSHYITPPPETVSPETPAALHMAMAQSHFHWGLAPWALYAFVGAAMAYSCFRRGRVSLISSTFHSLFGESPAGSIAGRVVDIFAIWATLFGTAASLGISAIQLGEGYTIISGAGEVTNTILIAILTVLTVCFIISAVSGVSKGIRYLSNANITLTLGLIVFVFLTGPTLFLLNLIPSGTLMYVDELLPMLSRSLSWGEDTLQFQASWTAFYWAWWIAWTPFVGMFVARISRGRTIREFTIVATLVPTAILIFAFTIFGGTSISFRREGNSLFDGSHSGEQVLFALFGELPLHQITPFILMVVLAIFFITSADSASVVMGTMSTKGNPAPPKPIVVFWGLCMMGIAVVMLLAGGEEALSGLQSLIILMALPFSAILIVMMVAFLMDLRKDPAAIRSDYAKTAVANAVRRGVEEHGDDFELSIQSARDGRGAGADFDSADSSVTDWYQRTNEAGEPVDYDFSTDTWADGYEDSSSDE
ncbi:BCCT family transporter [Corynebacterium glucuronolyticum]|uniref:BCCT family transporter n=1 Tax=Corynebacterium glucuronolyticum TaxID=39791 RepID=UPI00019C1771|nr:BCCT family transporter [Corynebacterium glucuronolyticum]EEI26895.1 transporter, betaine/carnitine/choline family [Corynebacterium glucuronolyticum ATCC 51867]QRO83682.1 BCCT family transporter [Corynebacterium glucuronolyticum]